MQRVPREPESASLRTARLVLGAVAVLTFVWLALRGDHGHPPAKAVAVARASPGQARAAPASTECAVAQDLAHGSFVAAFIQARSMLVSEVKTRRPHTVSIGPPWADGRRCPSGIAGHLMPNKKKIVMPIAAAVAFALVLWLAFHDRSTDPAPASPPAKSSRATPPQRLALGVRLIPAAPSRTPARSADPASSRS